MTVWRGTTSTWRRTRVAVPMAILTLFTSATSCRSATQKFYVPISCSLKGPVSPGKETLGFICLSQSKNNCSWLLHEWSAGRCETQSGLIICPHWLSWSSPSPISNDWCMVRTPTPFSLAVMVGLLILSSEQRFFSALNLCHMDLWVAWLVLTHHHQQLPSSSTPWERVS